MAVCYEAKRAYFPAPERRHEGRLKAAGIGPPENEEKFYVGRLNYAKGMRLKYYKTGPPSRDLSMKIVNKTKRGRENA
jgi:hypothetical protein